MTEIREKLILVQVSARFELARVRVIGSRMYTLYSHFDAKSFDPGQPPFKVTCNIA